jgi:hypothetical protein
MKQAVCVIAAAVLALLPSASHAADQSKPVFGIHPLLSKTTVPDQGHFRFEMVSGTSQQAAAVIDNYSASPLALTFYGADMVQAEGGGVAPAQVYQTMHEVGAWIKVAQTAITVPASSSMVANFTVTVPIGQVPGDHVGAVTAQANIGIQNGITTQERLALLVDIVIPGTVAPSATLSQLVAHSAGPGKDSFTIDLTNTGNVLITTHGIVSINDDQGNQVGEVQLVPQDSYAIPNGVLQLHSGVYTFGKGSFTVRAKIPTFVESKLAQTYTSNALSFDFSDLSAFVIGGAIAGFVVLAGLAVLTGLALGRRPSRGAKTARVAKGSGE